MKKGIQRFYMFIGVRENFIIYLLREDRVFNLANPLPGIVSDLMRSGGGNVDRKITKAFGRSREKRPISA